MNVACHVKPLPIPLLNVRLCARMLSTDRPTINMPPTTSKSWERGAKLVKDTDKSNQYLEHIRATHDPAVHVKTIEEELRGTIGKALGKQGEKILGFLRKMARDREAYDDLVESGAPAEEVRACAGRYNESREQAWKARWELIVHRQAVGFIVDNHSTVQKMFPIDEPLLVDEENAAQREVPRDGEDGPKKFGDQLDWWQRVGRWR